MRCSILLAEGTSETPLWPQARLARAFHQRLVGLLGRTRMEASEAFILQPCSSVHTIGMRMPIDVLFLDRLGTVKKIARNVRPFRAVSCRGCCTVIEVSANNTQMNAVQLGDTLVWR